MSWDEMNPYFIYGLVDPREWDWRSFGENIAKGYWREPKAFINIDTGKPLGLIQRLHFLEEALKEERETMG